jgi:hypothetical protein
MRYLTRVSLARDVGAQGAVEDGGVADENKPCGEIVPPLKFSRPEEPTHAVGGHPGILLSVLGPISRKPRV